MAKKKKTKKKSRNDDIDLNNSDEKDNSMGTTTIHETVQDNASETLGNYLKSFRMKKNIDLKSIAINTRINFNILQDLENNNFSDLPNRTYLRGFVKNMAKFVEADESYALKLLDIHLGEISSQEKRVVEQSAPTESSSTNEISQIANNVATLINKELKEKTQSINPKFIVSAGAVVLVISLIVYGISSLVRTTNQEMNSTEIAKGNTQEKNGISLNMQKNKPKEITAKEETSFEKPVSPTIIEDKNIAHPLPKKKESAPEEQVAKVKKETIKRIRKTSAYNFTPMEYPLYTLVEDDKLNNLSIFPKKVKEAYTPGKANVFINAVKADTWLIYKNTGARIKQFILRKGRTLFVRGEEIRLFLGNFGAVEIMYNNKRLQTKAPTGVKSLVFPETSIKKYRTPLFVKNKKTDHFMTESEYLKSLEE